MANKKLIYSLEPIWHFRIMLPISDIKINLKGTVRAGLEKIPEENIEIILIAVELMSFVRVFMGLVPFVRKIE